MNKDLNITEWKFAEYAHYKNIEANLENMILFLEEQAFDNFEYSDIIKSLEVYEEALKILNDDEKRIELIEEALNLWEGNFEAFGEYLFYEYPDEKGYKLLIKNETAIFKNIKGQIQDNVRNNLYSLLSGQCYLRYLVKIINCALDIEDFTTAYKYALKILRHDKYDVIGARHIIYAIDLYNEDLDHFDKIRAKYRHDDSPETIADLYIYYLLDYDIVNAEKMLNELKYRNYFLYLTFTTDIELEDFEEDYSNYMKGTLQEANNYINEHFFLLNKIQPLLEHKKFEAADLAIDEHIPALFLFSLYNEFLDFSKSKFLKYLNETSKDISTIEYDISKKSIDQFLNKMLKVGYLELTPNKKYHFTEIFLGITYLYLKFNADYLEEEISEKELEDIDIDELS